MKATDKIQCPNKKRLVAVDACLEGYTNATAMKNKKDPCCACKDGKQMRDAFAEDLPIPEHLRPVGTRPTMWASYARAPAAATKRKKRTPFVAPSREAILARATAMQESGQLEPKKAMLSPEEKARRKKIAEFIVAECGRIRIKQSALKELAGVPFGSQIRTRDGQAKLGLAALDALVLALQVAEDVMNGEGA